MGSYRWFLFTALVITILPINSLGSTPFSLYGSFQATHDVVFPNGGIRFCLNDDICFDATLGARAGYDDDSFNGITGYVDFFFFRQSIGIGVTLSKYGDADLATTVSLLYALEKTLTDKVTLGISPTIVSKTFLDGFGVDFLSGFTVYTIIAW